MKKILLLAGQEVHCKVVEVAKNMGIHITVLDNLEDSPAKRLANASVNMDVQDVEGICDLVRKNKIDGVMNFCNEPSTRYLQSVNERLGFPNIGSREQVEIMTDKRLFKDACKKYGVEVIPEYSINDIEASKVEYPVIVKPVDSRSSRGVTVCRSKLEINEAVEAAKLESKSKGFIIEKYLENKPEIRVTYIIRDGEPYLIGLADRYVGRQEDNLAQQAIAFFHPSRFSQMYINNVEKYVIKFFRGLEIKNAAVFLQGFIDGSTIRFHDPAIRCPGDEYERILDKATGLNIMKLMLRYFLLGEMGSLREYREAYELNGKLGIQYIINVKPGKIGKIRGISTIKKHPSIIHVAQLKNEGDSIPCSGGIEQRVLNIVALCERRMQQAEEIIQFIKENIVILDTNGDNMIISLFSEKIVKLSR